MDKNIFLIDAHLDLSMNAIEWNRDLTKPLAEIRSNERYLTDKNDRGRGTVCLPELRNGKIGLVVATQLSRVADQNRAFPGYSWNSPYQAWAMTQAQLTWYREMEKLGEMVQITSNDQLDKHLTLWEDDSVPDADKPIGFVLSLEGADSLVDISYLQTACEYGLRAIGPAHFGPGRYAAGTKSTGGLTGPGKELLKEMDGLGMILDITHLTDEGFYEAVNLYKGPVWASHCNVRKIVNTQRQLSDEQVRILIERDAVIGGMLDCWSMDNRFIDQVSDPWQLNIRMENLVDHWDHICQLAGNSLHVAIGSDLDGNYGTEQTPLDLNAISDLQKYQYILQKRGYSEGDIENIFYKNWLRILRKTLN